MSARRGPPAWAQWVFLAMAVTLGLWAIAAQWEALTGALESVSVAWVVASALFAALALAVSTLAWRTLVVTPGSAFGVTPALQVFCLGQAGKYLPGSVWPLVAQMELSRQHGVPRRRSATATIIALAMAVVVGGLVGAAAIPIALPELPSFLPILLVPVVLASLHPRTVAHGVGLLMRLARQDSEPFSVAPRRLAVAWLWTAAAWLAFSLHAVCLGLAQGVGGEALVTVASTFALAWVAGFLVFVAPAGLGVREAVLTVGLAPVMPPGEALALALLSRAVLTGVDLAAASVAAATARRTLTRDRGASSASE